MNLFIIVSFLLSVSANRISFEKQGKLRARIVGGEDVATPEQFPWQVSVQWSVIQIWQHICGGSIISPTCVITAAHCISEISNIGSFRVATGIVYLSDSENYVTNVEEMIVHPQYKGGVNPYDIALLMLSTPLNFSSTVQMISLPQPESIPTGNAVTSGWGSTSRTADPIMPNILQTAVLPLLTLDECKQALINALGDSAPLDDTNICSGPLNGTSGVCSGDSGGPLVLNNQLIGIVSWGVIPCASNGIPNVYTRVSAFIDFITDYVYDLP